MTSNSSTIEQDTSVADAARVMNQEDAGVVPVTENGRLTGMVTDRDRAIRVVAEKGVVAQADVTRHGDDSKTGQVVQEISE
jgi:predicted transcriptional regulator